ncbi:hypothetical protein [Alkalihalobacillus trypoxylicola]|uniref:Histidine kinase n=1 Tax=Alkalihalobacillus trypoxylicola TaxID=519424 RepID=A0A161Q366_9BACI|nr:hypothetical protein [Alkalihalobacillus trypoxylicola]KYG30408.1 hypothetical protein AZF04_19790 [Alkalihalobacillus trypoxylicola]GAF65215.1 osmosensitive potassium channel histidine kinase [Bacillus sp. TS-2]
MEKSILVCVSYGKNAEKLIQKGKYLADKIGVACYVLSIENKEYDSKDFTMAEHKKFFEDLASQYQCEFLWKTKGSKRISDIIAKTAEEFKISQVVMGQPPISKWEVITKGSIIHELLHCLVDVDLHIVAMKKENVQNEEELFQRGINAYIVASGEQYELVTDRPNEFLLEGIYFQSVATEFTNGVFKSQKNGKEILVRIHDGKADYAHLGLLKEEEEK